MYLNELIATLKAHNPKAVVREGFSSPHSYRGYYERLAFVPTSLVTVADMLVAAQEAMGATYQGYKGGSYVMGEWTDCYLANYGDCGDELSPRLLGYMLSDVVMEANT